MGPVIKVLPHHWGTKINHMKQHHVRQDYIYKVVLHAVVETIILSPQRNEIGESGSTQGSFQGAVEPEWGQGGTEQSGVG